MIRNEMAELQSSIAVLRQDMVELRREVKQLTGMDVVDGVPFAIHVTRVTHSEVIQRILDHLGLKAKLVPERKAYVELEGTDDSD